MMSAAQSTLLGVIDSCLAGILVLLNRMVTPMDLGPYNFLETYHPPVGMVQLAALCRCGFNLLRGLLINNIPDIYCMMRQISPQSTRTDDLAPEWEERSHDFMMYIMDQKGSVDIYNKEVANSDRLL
jgi:hypothetical protein